MAQSGTVTIDSVTGTISGSLDNVVFKEVNATSGALVADGCENQHYGELWRNALGEC